MLDMKQGLRVKVKSTGQIGVVYGPVAGSGESFSVIESPNGDVVTKPIATQWGKWHVSLDNGGMGVFSPSELDEFEDEEFERRRRENADARWDKFIKDTYGQPERPKVIPNWQYSRRY